MTLNSTESTLVDLIALRNWHFRASVDKNRAPDMRKWHANQVLFITEKLQQRWAYPRNLVKLAFIEMLAGRYRDKLHEDAGALAPFAWNKFCEQTRKQLASQVKKPSKSS